MVARISTALRQYCPVCGYATRTILTPYGEDACAECGDMGVLEDDDD